MLPLLAAFRLDHPPNCPRVPVRRNVAWCVRWRMTTLLQVQTRPYIKRPRLLLVLAAREQARRARGGDRGVLVVQRVRAITYYPRRTDSDQKKKSPASWARSTTWGEGERSSDWLHNIRLKVRSIHNIHTGARNKHAPTHNDNSEATLLYVPNRPLSLYAVRDLSFGVNVAHVG